MSKDFNNYRFAGLAHHEVSNKYLSMSRVSDDETKIVVNVADCHLFETRYGFGLILDASHVVWLKDWAVSMNWYGNEVMLDKAYFNVKAWGSFASFDDEPENCTWEHFLNIAKMQQDAGTIVHWAK